MNQNLEMLGDSYKHSHLDFYPPETTKLYSYFESRGGEFQEIVFFGLQYIMKKYLVNPQLDTSLSEFLLKQHFQDKVFHASEWNRINQLGYLPISIKAVPEGTVVSPHNVLMTIENTQPWAFWLPNFLETLLVQVWCPTTVATQSRYIKKILKKYAGYTQVNPSIDFQCHCFGCRGVSTMETAAIAGLSHLVNFKGSDTLPAIQCCRDYYNQASNISFSVRAMEHSTVLAWGKDREEACIKNALDKIPKGTLSIICDTYDVFSCLTNIICGSLREQILNRDGVTVCRLDSGDPKETIIKALEILAKGFGYTVNKLGYKVLHHKVRILQGDGVDRHSIEDILREMMSEGWSSENIIFGSGGALLQKLNRDTCKFAFKTSYVEENGISRDVRKEPVGDKSKWSKAGKLKLVHNLLSGGFLTFKQNEISLPNQMVEVFRDGRLLVDHNFQEIRERATL